MFERYNNHIDFDGDLELIARVSFPSIQNSPNAVSATRSLTLFFDLRKWADHR